MMTAGWLFAEENITPQELAQVKRAEQARVAAIERVYGCVVAIYGNNRQGGGSGVVFDPSGLALTNHHVVAAAGTSGWAGLADGKFYRWRLVGSDPGGDVAVIQLNGKERFAAAPLGNSDTVRVGDWAMAMGNPFMLAEDQKPTVTLGIVSGVRRYQRGAGNNMLVYGDCIQVDSSINPGNSGGPLFNMQGEVIGINGRGSFLERGRVNVGLGYAISANQVKRFLPDLLATKLAQHGTLDALFRNQQGQVICHTINLDAPIAQAGLQLGDALVSLDGKNITDANQLANLISTLPAGWPTEVVFRRGEKQHVAWVRLLPLPYRKFKPAPTEKKEKKTPPPRPLISLDNPGAIRDEALNLQNCRRLTERWRAFAAANGLPAGKGIELIDDLLRGDNRIGRQTTLLSADGRFRVEQTIDGRHWQAGFDGKQYWMRQSGEKAETLSLSKALLHPAFSQAAVMATLLEKRPLERFGKPLLDGGDKASGRLAYRIKTIDEEGDWFYLWLSVLAHTGQPQVELLKTGPDRDAAGPDYAVRYSQWRPTAGVMLPHHREVVEGLSEKSVLTMSSRDAKALGNVGQQAFEKPQDDR